MLGGGAFLPVHWGTFSLAIHAWDEPAETLFKQAPASGARLLMPRLGEPVEPDLAGDVKPWWRGVDAAERDPLPAPAEPAMGVRAAAPVLEWPLD